MRILTGLFLSVFIVTACKAEPSNDKLVTSDIYLKTTIVADGLDYPWAVEFLPNGEYLVTERPGKLIRVSSDGSKTEISGVPSVYDKGQGGLLDVIAGPENKIYLSYAAADADGLANTEVAVADLNLADNRLENVQTIFTALPKVKGNNHWGSRLLLDDNGGLYVTLGERFDYRDEAQNPENNIGTVSYVYPDGRSEVYSYGHRNVQGIARHPETAEVWTHEHGPKGGDEVNILKKGANYGWPLISYGRNYSGTVISESGEHEPEFTAPVLHWTPSIAPSGMTFYTGDKFPEWQGDLFAGALVMRHLRRVKLDGTRVVEQEELLKDIDERIRDVATGPDGYIYVLTDSDDGKLIRLSK